MHAAGSGAQHGAAKRARGRPAHGAVNSDVRSVGCVGCVRCVRGGQDLVALGGGGCVLAVGLVEHAHVLRSAVA